MPGKYYVEKKINPELFQILYVKKAEERCFAPQPFITYGLLYDRLNQFGCGVIHKFNGAVSGESDLVIWSILLAIGTVVGRPGAIERDLEFIVASFEAERTTAPQAIIT